MKICARWHEEVVFDESTCPVCSRMNKIDEMDNEIKILVGDLRDANEEIATLRKDVEDYVLQIEQLNKHE